MIVDVFDKDHCVCRTEEGQVLEGMYYIAQIRCFSQQKSQLKKEAHSILDGFF